MAAYFCVFQKVLPVTKSNARLDTLFLSPRVLSWLYLGQHMNLFKTHTHKKRLSPQAVSKNPLLFCPATPRKSREFVVWFPWQPYLHSRHHLLFLSNRALFSLAGRCNPVLTCLSSRVPSDKRSQGGAVGPLTGQSRRAKERCLAPHPPQTSSPCA